MERARLTRQEIRAIAEELANVLLERQPERLLNVKQAAEYLAVSQSYIYHNAESIPHERIGSGKGSLRFTERALHDYVTRRR